VSRTTLFAAVRDKKLTAHKPAKAYLFSSAELDRWVRAEGARRRKAS
jgi:excisionase family DNA binding protein